MGILNEAIEDIQNAGNSRKSKDSDDIEVEKVKIVKQSKSKIYDAKYSCQECNFTSMDERRVERHISSNHSSNDNSYKCHKCSFTASFRHNLESHVKNEHESTKKKSIETLVVDNHIKRRKEMYFDDDMEEE